MKMLGIIFSNIYDTVMGDLTKHRTLASLPFGGRYRQIDFVLSSMVNSNISSVGVITKYNYQSLMDHLGSSNEWDLNRKNGGLFILPPFGTGQTTVYRGKIEALYGATNFLEKAKGDYVVIADSNVLCNINFEEVLATHTKSGAEVTVVARRGKPSVPRECEDLVMKVEDGKVTDIMLNCPYDESVLCGMGMYIMEKGYLLNLIYDSIAHGYYHFEKDFLQKQFIKNDLEVAVHEFKGVALHNADINTYFKNNMRLLEEDVRNDIFTSAAPIYTKVRDEAPTYYGAGSVINDCLIADGCRIEGTVENAIIFRDVTISKGSVVRNAIVMQGSVIGENAHIEYSIIDKNVHVSASRTLIGAANSPVIIPKDEEI